jgi:hypothetical protein
MRRGNPIDTASFLTACSSNAVSPRRLVASGFNQLEVALALQYGVVRYREMTTLDWQVLIVAFVAISLQIMTSIKPDVRQISGHEEQYLA